MPNNHKPFFSIVIPTLNEEKYLPSLLKNLSQQTFKNFEVIVVDGKSDDQTIKRAQQFQKKINLQIISINKKNAATQRNKGGKLSKGNWIIFMDADDWIPKYFLRGIKYRLEKNQKIDVFSTCLNTTRYRGHEKFIYEIVNLYLLLSAKTTPVSPGAMIGVKKNIFNKQQFDDSLLNQEDFHFIKQLVKKKHKFKLLTDPTYSFSLRRIYKEGLLKMSFIFLQTQFSYLAGIKFTEEPKLYPMKGGTYYEEE
jgi:glycosyltransferase involved in cell wall biosynthesis